MVLLANETVIVVEMKGRSEARQVDLDQASAYARDLRCYHRCCDVDSGGRRVHAVLVPMRARGYLGQEQGVHVVGPDALADLVHRLDGSGPSRPLDLDSFLASDAYRPLPTLVQAARELFHRGELRTIHRARAFTDPAVAAINEIVHNAARDRSRNLVLVTGVPGAGKTLVGLRVVHSHFLDDLAVPRATGVSSSPAVFLSGNGPLVQVLQYELRGDSSESKVFVRGIKDYVKTYSRSVSSVPPEHVIVFDEAQRAWDSQKMAEKHPGADHSSEPEQLVAFAERIPDWCVIIGLVGGGQEIHVGEEAGLGQWAHAIRKSADPTRWRIYGPSGIEPPLVERGQAPFEVREALNLDREIRFHMAQHLHRYVGGLLEAAPPDELRQISMSLETQGFHLRITRDLETAKSYLRDRYAENVNARFGLLASSKDRDLEALGVPNGFQATKVLKIGPWYSDAEDDDQGRSCRHLNTCITEFAAQGLELDASLVAWGTDLILQRGRWSIARARGYKRGSVVRDAFRLRLNSYRVLLTRGRDGVVVFVPPIGLLDETDQYLRAAGFVAL